jgi:hypothetical protein
LGKREYSDEGEPGLDTPLGDACVLPQKRSCAFESGTKCCGLRSCFLGKREYSDEGEPAGLGTPLEALTRLSGGCTLVVSFLRGGDAS